MNLIALEFIDQQTDNFGQRLEALIADVLGEYEKSKLHNKNNNGHPLIKKIEKAIFDRTGIKVSIITNQASAAILPFYSNRNHIFLNSFFRGNLYLKDQTKLLNDMSEKRGTVDLHKARVGGLFSEYDHPLYLNFGWMIKHDMNPAEITAITLHELGHAFNACSYADRTDTTNQVLVAVYKKAINRTGDQDLEFIYKELKKTSPSLQKEEIDKFLNGNRVVAGLAWFKVVIGIVRSQLQNDKYTETSYEQLSDHFASRFGYSAHLTTALKKIHGNDEHYAMWPRFFSHLIEVLITGLLAGMIALSIGVAFAPGAIIYSIFLYFWVYGFGESTKDYTYDGLKDRYKRIRQDAIDQLKSGSLNKAQSLALVNSINDIDEVIASTKEFTPWLNTISNFIFPSNRETLSQIEQEKLLEKLASNDLFKLAAEFKSLA